MPRDAVTNNPNATDFRSPWMNWRQKESNGTLAWVAIVCNREVGIKVGMREKQVKGGVAGNGLPRERVVAPRHNGPRGCVQR